MKLKNLFAIVLILFIIPCVALFAGCEDSEEFKTPESYELNFHIGGEDQIAYEDFSFDTINRGEKDYSLILNKNNSWELVSSYYDNELEDYIETIESNGSWKQSDYFFSFSQIPLNYFDLMSRFVATREVI